MHDNDVRDLIRLGRKAIDNSRGYYLDSLKRIKVGLEIAKKESFYKTAKINNDIDDLIRDLSLKISKAEEIRKGSKDRIKELCQSNLIHTGDKILCKECKKFYTRCGCKTEILGISKEFLKVSCPYSPEGEAFVSALNIVLVN